MTIHAFNKNSSATHSMSYTGIDTIEKLKEVFVEFEKEVNEIFPKWFWEIEGSNDFEDDLAEIANNEF